MKSICRAKMIGGPKPGAKPKTRGQESQRKIWGVDMNTKQVRRSGVDACKEECKVQNVKVSKGPATKKLHSRVDSTSGTQQKTCHASLKVIVSPCTQTPLSCLRVFFSTQMQNVFSSWALPVCVQGHLTCLSVGTIVLCL